MFCEELLLPDAGDDLSMVHELRKSNPDRASALDKRMGGEKRTNRISSEDFFKAVMSLLDSHTLTASVIDRLCFELQARGPRPLLFSFSLSFSLFRLATHVRFGSMHLLLRPRANKSRPRTAQVRQGSKNQRNLRCSEPLPFQVLGQLVRLPYVRSTVPDSSLLSLRTACGYGGLGPIDVLHHVKSAEQHGHLTLTLPWVCELLACFAPDKATLWPTAFVATRNFEQ